MNIINSEVEGFKKIISITGLKTPFYKFLIFYLLVIITCGLFYVL